MSGVSFGGQLRLLGAIVYITFFVDSEEVHVMEVEEAAHSVSDSSSAVQQECREVEGLDHQVLTFLTFGGGDVGTAELPVSVQVSRAVTTPLLLCRSPYGLCRSPTQQLYAPSASRRICYALHAPESFTVVAIITDTHSQPSFPESRWPCCAPQSLWCLSTYTNIELKRLSRQSSGSCVKVEVAVVDSPSLIVLVVSVDVKLH